MKSGKVLASLAVAACLCAAPARAQSDAGLETVKSANSAADTVTKLEAAIKAKGMTVFARIDHAGAAAAAGLSMPPSMVVIFGNPKAGTPNFLKKPTLAIDLPLKALVWQNAGGEVYVSYNTGAYVLGTIFPRHGLKPPMKAQQAQEAMLAGLAAAAVK